MQKDKDIHIGTTITPEKHRVFASLCKLKMKKISDIIKDAVDAFIKENKEQFIDAD